MDTKFNRNIMLMGVLIALLLLVVGCGGGAETTAPQPDSPEDAVDTTVPTATTAPTKKPEPTLTPTTEQTPTSTPEEDPRQALGEQDWFAIFEDGTETWFQYDHSNGKAEVRDDMLVLTSYKANGYDNWSMSYPLLEDFYLEVLFTTGLQCAGKDRFGIFFRAPESTNGYLYNVACDGSYQVRSWDGEEFTQMINWTVDAHIIPGPEVEHRLGVWAEGDHYKLYINGFQIGEFTDSTYLGESTFGVGHGATDTAHYKVYVTEAKAWELP